MITRMTNSKSEQKAAAWVQLAASKDDYRPVLTCINANGHLEAADGVRVHAANCSIRDENGKAITGLLKVNKDIVETSDLSADKYPKIKQVTPKGEPVASVTLYAKQLLDACKGSERVTIELRGEKVAVLIYGNGGEVETLSITMPLHVPDEKRWNPYE